MAEAKSLKATARPKVGKGAARATRLNNQIPAVIYGGGEPPLSISLDQKQATQIIYAGHFLTTVFDIDVDGKTIRALPRDYQLHPVRDQP
ncbi:MAG: 50S ribosomal protein L25/general stress protein Ctc, partial [Beijerinckiaceae bacterium]